MKRLISAMLVVVMLFSLASVAFAEDAVTIANGDKIYIGMDNFESKLKYNVAYSPNTPIDNNLKQYAGGYKFVFTSYKEVPEGITDVDIKTVEVNLKMGNDNIDTITSAIETAFNIGTVDKSELDPRLYAPYNYSIFPFEFTEDNFNIQYKVERGKELIEKPYFDGGGNIVLKFRDRETIPSKNKPDFVLTDITVRSRRTINRYDETVMVSGRTFSLPYDNFNRFKREDGTDINLQTNNSNYVTVGTKVEEVDVSGGEYMLEENMGKKVKITSYDDSIYKANAYFDNGEVALEGRVFVGENIKFDLNFNMTPAIKDLFVKNIDATIDVYNIVMEGSASTYNIKLMVQDVNGIMPDKLRIYTVDKSTGVITPASLRWNPDEYVWEGKMNGSTTYLVSDMPLKGVAAAVGPNGKVPAINDKSPETGGNTYVGIAAALALVSAIGLGAIAVKNKKDNI